MAQRRGHVRGGRRIGDGFGRQSIAGIEFRCLPYQLPCAARDRELTANVPTHGGGVHEQRLAALMPSC